MLKMRLQRVGRVHEPSFRLVLTDSNNATKSGRFKEILGSYDPRKDTDSLNAERIKYWLSQGAEPTDTVHNLLVKHKILDAKKVHVSTKSKFVPPVPEVAAEETPAEAVPAETPAPAAAPETSADTPSETVEESAVTTMPAEESEVGAPTKASE